MYRYYHYCCCLYPQGPGLRGTTNRYYIIVIILYRYIVSNIYNFYVFVIAVSSLHLDACYHIETALLKIVRQTRYPTGSTRLRQPASMYSETPLMRRLFVICACTWIISTSAEGKLFDACNTTVWFRVSAHICSKQFF